MRRWLGSLRSRVFAATALVAVLPVALALGVVTRRAMQQAESDLARGLGEAARVVEQYHRARLDLAVERASLVADLPKLKAAVAEADARTAEPVARDYRERVRADVFVVADRHGRTLASLGTATAELPTMHEGAEYDRTAALLGRHGVDPTHDLIRLVNRVYKWHSHLIEFVSLELRQQAATKSLGRNPGLIRNEENGPPVRHIRIRSTLQLPRLSTSTGSTQGRLAWDLM